MSPRDEAALAEHQAERAWREERARILAARANIRAAGADFDAALRALVVQAADLADATRELLRDGLRLRGELASALLEGEIAEADRTGARPGRAA